MKRDEKGSGHPLMILLIVVVLIAIGGAGYYVWHRQKGGSKTLDTALSKAEVQQLNTECNTKYNDKDLCKFLATWTDNKNYKSTITSTAAGQTSTFSYTLDGTNYQMVSSTNGAEQYNTIVIGDTTYTKDPSDNQWWKQTAKPDAAVSSETQTATFDSSTTITETEDTSKYTAQGKEACGKLTCFKYELTDTKTPNDKQTFWFDTKDYLLRRWTSDDGAGNTSDSAYTYDNVSVSAPTPTKDLPSGSVVLPDGSTFDASSYNYSGALENAVPTDSEE